MIELLVPFLAGIVTEVPRLVGVWVEQRNATRLAHTREVLISNANESELLHARRLRDLEIEVQEAGRYPLGGPGRVRGTLGPASVPTVLVSPVPPGSLVSGDSAAGIVMEIVRTIDDHMDYVSVPTGAFPHEAGVARWIAGEIDARNIAVIEFAHRPAIIVYFDVTPLSVTARAYLSTVFGTTDGTSTLTFTIARFTISHIGEPVMVPRGGDLPSWRTVELGAFSASHRYEVMGIAVAAFVVATVDAYWRIQHGRDPNLFEGGRMSELLDSLILDGMRSVPSIPRLAAALDRDRIEQDAERLVMMGFAVEAEDLGDGLTGLILQGPLNARIVLDDRYPLTPPRALRIEEMDIDIRPDGWSPESSLVDVMEAACQLRL